MWLVTPNQISAPEMAWSHVEETVHRAAEVTQPILLELHGTVTTSKARVTEQWAIRASVPHSGRLRGWLWQLLQAQAAMQFLENFQEGDPNYRVRQLPPFPNLRHVLTSGLCFGDSDGHGLNWRCIFIDSYISHRSLIYIYEHCAIYKNRMEPLTS